jgi:YD repeat-containing protein
MEFRDAPSEILPFLRHYNSLSPLEGWFGKGWGSTLETKIIIMDAQNVAILPYGSGSPKIFSAGHFTHSDSWPLPKDEKAKTRLLARFNKEPSYLFIWLEQNGVKTKAPDKFMVQAGPESLVKNGNNWKWTDSDGVVWQFNDSGQLIKVIGLKEWELIWKENLVSQVKTPQGVYDFKFDHNNLIQIKSEGFSLNYLFKNNQLIQSIDSSGNKFEYDYNGIGQITTVKEGGKDFITAVYHPTSSKVTRISDPQGKRSYKFDEKNNGSTKIVKVEIKPDLKDTVFYESHYTTQADGSLFRSKLIEKDSRGIREYEFDPRVTSPVKIISDGESQESILDSKGHVIELRSRGEVVGNFLRDPKGNKILEVKEPLETRTFGYDTNGKLNKVSSNLGYEIKLNQGEVNQLLKLEFLKTKTNEKWIVEPIYKSSQIKGYKLNGKVVNNIQDKISLLGFLQQTMEAFKTPILRDPSP